MTSFKNVINKRELIKMTTCSICLEDSNDETKTVACNHIFHATCIDEWLKSHSTCPVCRMRLQEPSFESVYNFLQTVPDVITEMLTFLPTY